MSAPFGETPGAIAMAFVQEIATISREKETDPIPDGLLGIGCFRNPFSVQEDQAIECFKRRVRDTLVGLIEDQDFVIYEDPIGNAFAEIFAEDRNERAVMHGSHVDGVPFGGNLDGVLGVASGIEIVHALVRSGQKPKRTLRLAAFRGEESNKTGRACIGSFYATGLWTREDLEQMKARPGVLLKDHFGPERWALIIEGLKRPTITPENTDSAFELHIEQSANVDAYDRLVGIVLSIGGAWREEVHAPVATRVVRTANDAYRVCRMTFIGVSDHTGATPPNPDFSGSGLRRFDALVASSHAASSLMRHEGVVLVRSTPVGDDTGFTLVPHGQIVEMLVESARVGSFETRIRESAAKTRTRFGVQMTYEISACAEQSMRVPFRADMHRLMMIPAEVSSLSTRAYQREGTELGKTRVTIADFRLTAHGFSFKIDGREADHAAGASVRAEVHACVHRHSDGSLQFLEISASDSVPTDPEFTERLRGQVRETFVDGAQVTYLDMDSFPGHDLKPIMVCGVKKGAMLFVRQRPNPNGVSHSAYETAEFEHVSVAMRVAIPFVLRELGVTVH